MNWNRKKISFFLKERPDRFKPEEANEMNLKRLEKIDFSGNMHIIENKPTKTGMILIKKGDLVISGINVEKGAVAVYTGEDDLLATIHYSSYEFDENQINIGYFKWFLKSKNFHDVLLTQTKGGIKTELKPKKFLPLEILLPRIDEQKKILNKINDVIDEINDVINSFNNVEDFVNKLCQSILQEAVKGKLTADWRKENPDVEIASELLKRIKTEKEKLIKEKKIKKQKPLPLITKDEIPFELPEGWIWCRLGEIQSHLEYGTSVKSETDGEIPVFSMGHILNGKLVYRNFKYTTIANKDIPRLYLYNNDILFNRTNSWELVGKSALFNDENNKYSFASYLIRIRFLFVSSIFMNFVLNSIYFRKSQIEPQIIKQCGQANFNGTKLKNTFIPLPPLQEQLQIVEKVDKLMHLCDELEDNVKQAKEYSGQLMEAMLREAFDGEKK